MYRRRAITEDSITSLPRVTWAALGLSSSGLIIYQDQYAKELSQGTTVNGFRLDPLPLRSIRLRRTGPYTFSYVDPSPSKAIVGAVKVRAVGKKSVRPQRKSLPWIYDDPEDQSQRLFELKVDESFEPLEEFVQAIPISEEPSMEMVSEGLRCDFWRRLIFRSFAEPFQQHQEIS